ncbi:MAG TPA: TetR/AcrR family transcriptional regulator [Phototrophicaceae bacterium]|nr:TetR/AcrR family transcriptional regulator [Phototrophicaceae bacterium]
MQISSSGEGRQDRRPERTRQWLQKALIDLIEDYDYGDISIQMIADQANVARITFYRHYHDKNELLMDYIESVREELAPFVKPVSPGTMMIDGNIPPMLPMFRYIAQHRQLYKRILCGSIAAVARRYILESMIIYTSDNVRRLLPHVDEDKRRMITYCINTTTLGMLAWWLENDEPCTVEELAATVFQHNTIGMAGFISSQT